MKYEEMTPNRSWVGQLPRWAKILFRLFSILVLLNVITMTFFIVNLLFATNTSFLIELPLFVTLISIVLILSFLVPLIFLSIGIFQCKRWVLPLVLLQSSSILLIGVPTLFSFNVKSLADLITLLLVVAVSVFAIFIAINYKLHFNGPAKKLIFQVPILLVLIPFISLAVFTSIFPDEETVNDSDLVLQPEQILTQSENAHYFLPVLSSLSVQEDQDYQAALQYTKSIESVNTKDSEVVDLVDETSHLTDAFIEASSKQGYQCPTSVNNYGPEAVVCNLNDIRQLAFLTALRAEVEAGAGDVDQAIPTAVSIVKLGALIGSAEQPQLIEQLIGIVLMDTGLSTLQRIINTSETLPEDVVTLAISDLESSTITDAAFVNSLKREYVLTKNATDQFEHFGSHFYHPNRTTNQRAEIFREYVNIFSRGCAADTGNEQQRADVLVEEINQSGATWSILLPNYFGRLINKTLVNSQATAHDSGCERNKLNQQIQDALKNKMLVATSSQAVSIDDLTEGDVIKGMRVEKVTINPHVYFVGDTRSFIIEFSGQAQVTGRLYGPGMACDVGLALDQESRERLPQVAEYETKSFCFFGDQRPVEEIGSDRIERQETVTLLIDNFTIYRANKGGGPTATFVSVVE